MGAVSAEDEGGSEMSLAIGPDAGVVVPVLAKRELAQTGAVGSFVGAPVAFGGRDKAETAAASPA
jgi:hypothetical protein